MYSSIGEDCVGIRLFEFWLLLKYFTFKKHLNGISFQMMRPRCFQHLHWKFHPYGLNLFYLRLVHHTTGKYKQTIEPCRSVRYVSDWWKFRRLRFGTRVWHISFVKIDHKVFSTVILSLLRILKGQISETGERKGNEYYLTA